MLDMIKGLLGFGPKVDYAQLIREDAVIIDVRSMEEYMTGHIKGSKNIPSEEILKYASKFSKDKAIITCCASGMRSAMAKSVLKSNGYTRVYNGGSWARLQNKIN
ncbi:MAG TPA: sulfurtransferase [Lentisphaeria bacterium]|nr:MAG: sulfurtransferase [Lentisphaerae bacterium GWF2_38_69]HBM16816.1 sulfurtransferase [Lentisphaeria bacterium]